MLAEQLQTEVIAQIPFAKPEEKKVHPYMTKIHLLEGCLKRKQKYKEVNDRGEKLSYPADCRIPKQWKNNAHGKINF